MIQPDRCSQAAQLIDEATHHVVSMKPEAFSSAERRLQEFLGVATRMNDEERALFRAPLANLRRALDSATRLLSYRLEAFESLRSARTLEGTLPVLRQQRVDLEA